MRSRHLFRILTNIPIFVLFICNYLIVIDYENFDFNTTNIFNLILLIIFIIIVGELKGYIVNIDSKKRKILFSILKELISIIFILILIRGTLVRILSGKGFSLNKSILDIISVICYLFITLFYKPIFINQSNTSRNFILILSISFLVIITLSTTYSFNIIIPYIILEFGSIIIEIILQKVVGNISKVSKFNIGFVVIVFLLSFIFGLLVRSPISNISIRSLIESAKDTISGRNEKEDESALDDSTLNQDDNSTKESEDNENTNDSTSVSNSNQGTKQDTASDSTISSNSDIGGSNYSSDSSNASSKNDATYKDDKNTNQTSKDGDGGNGSGKGSGEGQGNSGSSYANNSGTNNVLDNSKINYSNINGEDIDSSLILTFKCNNKEIDRLKDASYGDYDYDTSSFLLDDELPPYASSIIFETLFNRNDGYLDSKVTINTEDIHDYAYVPYSVIYSKNIKMYKDRIYKLRKPSNTYEINYHSGNNNQKFYNEEYKEYVYKEYLTIPTQLEYSLNNFISAHSINIKDGKQYNIDKIKYIFNNEFTYTYNDLDELPNDIDVITYFLNVSKKGYCIHFASSATLLFRMCGIPTRYVTGYLAQYNDEGVGYCKNPGHAWVEVFDDEKGWVAIDVTPSNALNTIVNENKLDNDNELSLDIDDNKDNEEIKDNNSTTNQIVNTSVNNSTFITMLIIVFTIVLARIILRRFILIKYSNTITLRQRIYTLYQILKDNNYVNDEVYFVMEKIRYSTYGENIDDEKILSNRFNQLINDNTNIIKKIRNKTLLLKLKKLRNRQVISNFKDAFSNKIKIIFKHHK